ncbi:PREDICTED: stromelysin-1 [Myotis davidii]|uniref:stromelysin-1 n=1 Tax=Myotis davidii TaxID=225400 RepID=UPI0007675FC0|nr:PREDICTED: stromelysin-1 [Myotis davidii]
MQKFLGLTVTGKLDSDTLEVMRKPRCGVPDIGEFRTFPGMPKWRKTHLTYRIVNYTPDLPRDAVDSAIEKALKVWEEVTPLTFSRIYEGEADIMITFAVRKQRDFYSFDGPGKVLAHAYLPGPGLNGDALFDDDKQWTKDASGTNLLLVAAHEVGHSLGLQHSANPEALMYSVYNSPTDLARFRLSQDDVTGIQSLNGPPPASPDDPVKPTESPSPQTPAKCDPTLSLDAVTTLRGEILFFKDRSPWNLQREFHLISALWSSPPSDLDAAYEVPKQRPQIAKIFLEKQKMSRNALLCKALRGKQFWAIRGNEVQAGYPRGIHTLSFSPAIRKMDAAVSDKEKKTYFFVEDKY